MMVCDTILRINVNGEEDFHFIRILGLFIISLKSIELEISYDRYRLFETLVVIKLNLINSLNLILRSIYGRSWNRTSDRMIMCQH